MNRVLKIDVLHSDVDEVLDQEVHQSFVVVDDRVVQCAVAGLALLEVHVYRLVLGVADVDELGDLLEVSLLCRTHELVASL